MKTPKQEDLIFDVGMHRGEDTEFYLKKGFRVVAFEADPGLVAANRERFSREIADARLIIVEGAIVENPTDLTVAFFRNLDNSVWGTIDPAWADRNAEFGTRSEPVEVPAIDFRRCLVEHGVPRYLKVDIEGADLVCIRSLREIDPKPDYVSIESDKTSIEATAREIDLFASLGYDAFQAVQQENIHVQRAPCPAREGADVDHAFVDGSSGPFGAELPARWMTHVEILEEYRRIHREYRWFGDATVWQRRPFGRRLLSKIARIAGRPLPGWYDTHARHRSANDPIA